MENECFECGSKDKDDLYRLNNEIFCSDCLFNILKDENELSVEKTITYCANGEYFDEGEESEMFEYLGAEKVKLEQK